MLETQANQDLRKTGKPGRAISLGIAAVFLIFGALSLVYSVYSDISILSLVGLGLVFWGALFLLISPKRFVEGKLLYGAAISSYATIDRIVTDLGFEGSAYYIPAYPKDAYLPDHLKGLKDLVVFISAEKDAAFPSVEGMAEGRFLLDNPKGVIVTPPGLGLVEEIEKKIRIDVTKVELKELCEVLPQVILDNFNVAKDITLEVQQNQVNLEIEDSLYRNLYDPKSHSESARILGCPIASAIACIVAKVSGKPVTVSTPELSPGSSVIRTQFNIEQGLTR